VSTRWPTRLLLGLTPENQARRRLPLVLGVLILPFTFTLAGSWDGTNERAIALNTTLAQTKQRDACYKVARQLIRSGEITRALGEPAITLLAPTDLATEILFFTPHRIVASNYHREGAGLAYVWGADKITDAQPLRAHLKQRNIAALLLCPKVAPDTNSLLQGYIHGGQLPAWLAHVPYQLAPSNSTDADDSETTPTRIQPLLLRVKNP
jgi:hypothetical protein